MCPVGRPTPGFKSANVHGSAAANRALPLASFRRRSSSGRDGRPAWRAYGFCFTPASRGPPNFPAPPPPAFTATVPPDQRKVRKSLGCLRPSRRRLRKRGRDCQKVSQAFRREHFLPALGLPSNIFPFHCSVVSWTRLQFRLQLAPPTGAASPWLPSAVCEPPVKTSRLFAYLLIPAQHLCSVAPKTEPPPLRILALAPKRGSKSLLTLPSFV